LSRFQSKEQAFFHIAFDIKNFIFDIGPEFRRIAPQAARNSRNRRPENAGYACWV
jgi:hypothetical protein